MPVTVAPPKSGHTDVPLESGPSFEFVSVIVPVSERHDDLIEMYGRFSNELKRVCRDFEFLVIFDGSMIPDARLVKAARTESRLRVMTLGQTFGEATVLRVGFEQSRGDILVTVPAYNQVAESGIIQVLEGLHAGNDLVIARRYPRHDGVLNRLQSSAFHALVRSTSGVSFRDMACGLRAFRREVVDSIPLYGDLHRFIPALALREGFRVEERDVEQHSQDVRRRLYRPGVYLRRVLDILTFFFLTKFTEKPLRFFGLIGAVVTLVGVVLSLQILVQRLMGQALANRPILLLAVLMLAVGVQIVGLGLVGEIIVHVRSPSRRAYRVRERV